MEPPECFERLTLYRFNWFYVQFPEVKIDEASWDMTCRYLLWLDVGGYVTVDKLFFNFGFVLFERNESHPNKNN
jgi:hypothetical protein